MTDRSLSGVRARLEDAVSHLPGDAASPQDTFDRIEMVAIAILDSEHADFPPGLLEEYLMTRLYLAQLELGLLPNFHETTQCED